MPKSFKKLISALFFIFGFVLLAGEIKSQGFFSSSDVTKVHLTIHPVPLKEDAGSELIVFAQEESWWRVVFAGPRRVFSFLKEAF